MAGLRRLAELAARSRLSVLRSVLLLTVACSSEPLAPSPGADGSGGSGGSGGSSGTRDYSDSPCYGQKRATDVYDFGTHMTRAAMATCRAEGERTLVFVADDLWENPFTQAEVNAFMAGYELGGRPESYRPELGILPTDELVFGDLAGPLNEGKLTGDKLPIFVISSGGAGDGYLCGWCNAVELHLDGPVLRSLHTDHALSIAAHESTHAIHRGYDANEAVWVDETLAQAAMTVNGFFTDQVWLESFLNATNTAWGPGVAEPREFNYGAGLLFGTYLWQRGGAELLRAITQEPLDEWAGIDAALALTGDPLDGFGVFQEMAVAVLVDDPATGYGFEAFDTDGLLPAIVETGTSYQDSLAAYGIVFVVLDDAARQATLEAPSGVTGRVVLGDDPVRVIDMELGEPTTFDANPRGIVITGRQAATFTLSVE